MTFCILLELNITKILQGTPTLTKQLKDMEQLNITKILQGTPTIRYV